MNLWELFGRNIAQYAFQARFQTYFSEITAGQQTSAPKKAAANNHPELTEKLK